MEASASGERSKIAFLACAGLIVGADPAVDGDLSQLNPLGNGAATTPQMLLFCKDNKARGLGPAVYR